MSATSKFSIHLSQRERVAVILPLLLCIGAKCAIPLCGRKATLRREKLSEARDHAFRCVALLCVELSVPAFLTTESKPPRYRIHWKRQIGGKKKMEALRVVIWETPLPCVFGLGLHTLRARTPGKA